MPCPGPTTPCPLSTRCTRNPLHLFVGKEGKYCTSIRFFHYEFGCESSGVCVVSFFVSFVVKYVLCGGREELRVCAYDATNRF